ncbi:MAG: 2,4'-dihydroxyacetophenone dioxygenase family protein [Acidimicrobiales bacterium]|nr:2,4'-dihydroxyacetophenone dioxygenase family protein [Acidimicrobiales bacterium]
MLTELTEAIHRGDDDLPFLDTGTGTWLKLCMVDLGAGLWVIRNRFDAGVQVQKHKHTGAVFGFTLAGAWKYAEYDYVNRAGSFLFEPAGSEHTLTVPADNTEQTDVWFAIYGANLNLAADGSIESITDAAGILAAYRAMAAAAGHPDPDVVVR